MLVYRRVNRISAPQLSERVLYHFLAEGTYRHHCAQLRSKLDQCRQPVSEKLISLGCEFEYMPDAGMYLWATLPHGVDADALAGILYNQGHYFAPGSLFLYREPELARRKMRFNISRTQDSAEMLAFEKLLGAT